MFSELVPVFRGLVPDVYEDCELEYPKAPRCRPDAAFSTEAAARFT